MYRKSEKPRWLYVSAAQQDMQKSRTHRPKLETVVFYTLPSSNEILY